MLFVTCMHPYKGHTPNYQGLNLQLHPYYRHFFLRSLWVVEKKKESDKEKKGYYGQPKLRVFFENTAIICEKSPSILYLQNISPRDSRPALAHQNRHFLELSY